jgi:hypothetical protein
MAAASARTGLSARLTAGSFATLAILASASVAGCAGSTPSTPTTFSPGTSNSTTASAGASKTATSTASTTPTPSPRVRHSASAKPRRTSHPASSVAPATGGGGTAGFQDPLLLAIGGAAILAGAGSIAYRRRAIRNR